MTPVKVIKGAKKGGAAVIEIDFRNKRRKLPRLDAYAWWLVGFAMGMMVQMLRTWCGL